MAYTNGAEDGFWISQRTPVITFGVSDGSWRAPADAGDRKGVSRMASKSEIVDKLKAKGASNAVIVAAKAKIAR